MNLKLSDFDWEGTNLLLDCYKRRFVEFHKVMTKDNEKEFEVPLKDLRARCVDLHYRRIEIMRQQWKKF